jgi:hypothetical protein
LLRSQAVPGEPRDDLQFEMMNGGLLTKSVAAGEGRAELEQVAQSASGWILIDENTRIRADKIVLVRLVENAHDAGPQVAYG